MSKELIILIILQLIAHHLSDFYFQWDKMVVKKSEKSFRTKYMYFHFVITLVFSWILSFQTGFFIFALFIALIHLLTDIVKSVFEKKYEKKHILSGYLFVLDQFVHLITVVFVSILCAKYHNIYFPDFIPDIRILTIIAGFIFIIKPANYYIKSFFKMYEIPIPKQDDLKNAGRFIGSIERFLVLIFVLLQQYEAIGFLLAAKSILRYNEQDKGVPNKTEYVLAGTLLSFTIAIVAGLIIIKITKNIDL